MNRTGDREIRSVTGRVGIYAFSVILNMVLTIQINNTNQRNTYPTYIAQQCSLPLYEIWVVELCVRGTSISICHHYGEGVELLGWDRWWKCSNGPCLVWWPV